MHVMSFTSVDYMECSLIIEKINSSYVHVMSDARLLENKVIVFTRNFSC